MGGYNRDEVDQFLSRVATDFETLYSENQLLKEKLARMELEISRYRKLEDSLNQTLVLAQKTAEEVKQQAAKEAELIIKAARQKAAELLDVYQDVVKRTEILIAEVKGLLSSQAEVLASSEERVRALSSTWSAEDIAELRNGLNRMAGPQEGVEKR